MNRQIPDARHVTTLASDILRGAGEIAIFLHGEDSPANRRMVYNHIRNSQMPYFKLGGICARRSTLMDWIEQQERQCMFPLPENQAAPDDHPAR